MYKKSQQTVTSISVNNGKEGETLETKVKRITVNKEPIKDGAPIIYTQRKDGIKPEYNIRSDRFELATDAMDRLAKQRLAQREERMKTDDVRKAEAEQKEFAEAKQKLEMKQRMEIIQKSKEDNQ